MAEPNQLVERIVRILSKRKTDDLDFSKIGVIKSMSYTQDDNGNFEYNYTKYDPSSIEDFFRAYEECLKVFNIDRFVYIGIHESLRSGKYA
jgi:hypothetical protein